MPTLLIRYGELGLKSESVRRRFEQALVQDIRRRHMLAEVPCVTSSVRGRLFVDSGDWRRSCELLSRTFGIVSFSPVTKVSSEFEKLKESVVEFSEGLFFKGASFAVRTRRTGNHPYSSQGLAEELGSLILESFGHMELTVDLDEPDSELFVEVRDRDAFLFSIVIQGPGGMPKGTQGKVLSAVSTQRGIASSWMLMKRGCNVLLASEDPGLCSPLRSWNPDLRVLSPDGDLFDLAYKHGCMGVAHEWDLRTLEMEGAMKGDLPVFYPLIGMTNDEVEVVLRKVLA